MPSTFTFRPALREQTNVMVGLAGPSGSGKTLSALKIARGLAGGDDTKIFVIDTEQGRALHYACGPNEQPGPFKFRFQHCHFKAPFSPENYAAVVKAAAAAGAKVIIVDSMSHEHEGEGGILEWHEQELKKMAGDDWAKRERVKFTAWIVPKAAHNRLVNQMLQQPCHMIFCFRAKDKLAMVKNDKGKIEPVKVGWTAICSDRFEYEMTALLTLPPNAKGVPDLAAEQTKLQEQHRQFFPAGKPITEEAGKGLASWAKGGVEKPAPKAETPPAEPPHDPETGEVRSENPMSEEYQAAEVWANATIRKMDTVTNPDFLDAWLEKNQAKLAEIRAVHAEAAMSVITAADQRKKALQAEGVAA